MRRALARDPLHSFAHEVLGGLELEACAGSDQRLRVAWALDPAQRDSAVVIARELFFRGHDDEGHALLRAADEQAPLIETQVLRARVASWRADTALAEQTLRILDDERLLVHPGTPAIAMMLRAVLGEITVDDISAFFAELLKLPMSPKRRGFMFQVHVELIANVDLDQATSHLMSAVSLPFIDLRWLDACPALSPLRALPNFHIARATVKLRTEEAFGNVQHDVSAPPELLSTNVDVRTTPMR